MRTRLRSKKVVAGLAACSLCAVAGSVVAGQSQALAATPTAIQHVVVIYGENISFDHYFGTYRPAPHGPWGEQTVNGLYDNPGANGTGTLLNNNPNLDLTITTQPDNPRQLDPTNVNDVLVCDQDHGYTDEEKAFDNGKMDNFPSVSKAYESAKNDNGQACNPSDVMNYYAGDTVTGLWNYANHFALNDNSFGTTFGPSAPGAINLASGNTDGVITPINGAAPYAVVQPAGTSGDFVPDGVGGNTLINDAQPYWDDCSTRDAVAMSGTSIGDVLNTNGLSWGWFQGGFRPSTSFATASPGQANSAFFPEQFASFATTSPLDTAAPVKGALPTTALPPGAGAQGLCNAVHAIGPSVGGIGGSAGGGPGQYGWKDDYIAHHEPFQYYETTANPHHLPPASLTAIGTDNDTSLGSFDKANHQYDTSDFDALVGAITRGQLPPSALPAVSFLKAPGYQDAHAQYSDPLDEQQFVAKEVNAIQHSPDWPNTMIVLAYDDSDGFYDHVYSANAPGANVAGQLENASNTAADVLTGCTAGSQHLISNVQGRCGYGPRLPFLVISPWAKSGFVDHTMTDQSSIIRFIEDNWGLPRINGSADHVAGSLCNMLELGAAPCPGTTAGGHTPPMFLDPITGREAATASEAIFEHKK